MAGNDEKAEQTVGDLERGLTLELSDEIVQATSELFRLEDILADVCKEIQSSLRFEFVGIQLIRPEERIIETVYETGIMATWSGRARHYLEGDPNLRDIQADIALASPPRIEIISGWDKRFDRWIYNQFGHAQFARVFVPIVLVRDQKGGVHDDWFDHYRWEVLIDEEATEGRHTVIELHLSGLDHEGDEAAVEIIATVEAGYHTPGTHISVQTATALAKLVAERALQIRKALLPYLLETIAECARELVRAHAASMHFLRTPFQRRFVYEVCSGRLDRRYLEAHPPRESGLGEQAIRAKEPKILPDPFKGQPELELGNFNPQIFAEGIRAMAAFPFLVDQKEGVLYVYFDSRHQFTESEIDQLQLFVNRAVAVIRGAILYAQKCDMVRQLTTLQAIEWSLVSTAEGSDLLHQIAWNSLNLLAADIIIIYEYYEADKRFRISPYNEHRALASLIERGENIYPEIAGKLVAEQEMRKDVNEHSALASLIERGENIYPEGVLDNPILLSNPIYQREKIESSAGILIKVGKETVGLMFIGYRRPHSFLGEEKRIIDTLASSAAITIRNRRLLETLNEILTTLDQEKVLELIVKRAVEITGADLGAILLLDPIKQELVAKVSYAVNSRIDPAWTPVKIGEGIVGWVALHGQTALVSDVQADYRYNPDSSNVGSQLCVPLLNRDHRILGVHTVRSSQTATFNRRDQGILETLAKQAVLAIQNAMNQSQLTTAETMATLGVLASALFHRMGSDVGAIRDLAQDILEVSMDEAQSNAGKILSTAERISREVQRLQRWGPETLRPIDLCQAVLEAWDQVSIPSDINISQCINMPDNLPKVMGAEQQLMEVFVNLIQNAVDAMPAGGTLVVEGKELEGGRWVVVQVEDTGTGIAEENLEKIFQHAYSTKKTHIGFGLWWTRAYIGHLEGQISVESQLRKGTIFRVALPTHR
jgi:GAF domain-containing protein